MDDVISVILGGGRGSRLFPLTAVRAKPAVPIAGKYRLIDIPVSNCLNSGVHKISILTQFNSVSLHRHISRTYNFDSFHPGWVQVLAAEQTFSSEGWYQGTADAVRNQLFEIKVTEARDILVLAGEHLYRMDYGGLMDLHRAESADVTVAVQPVAADEAAYSRVDFTQFDNDGPDCVPASGDDDGIVDALVVVHGRHRRDEGCRDGPAVALLVHRGPRANRRSGSRVDVHIGRCDLAARCSSPRVRTSLGIARPLQSARRVASSARRRRRLEPDGQRRLAR